MRIELAAADLHGHFALQELTLGGEEPKTTKLFAVSSRGHLGVLTPRNSAMIYCIHKALLPRVDLPAYPRAI